MAVDLDKGEQGVKRVFWYFAMENNGQGRKKPKYWRAIFILRSYGD